MVTNQNMQKVMKILEEKSAIWQAPVLTQMGTLSKEPYHVLIACLLSLRTKDEVTGGVARRLFDIADTPEKMIQLSVPFIAKTIYPVGFYRTKAQRIWDISKTLIEKYQGKVPSDIDELLTLKGVGRKTANLVITVGYQLPGICVDTHVHRISNRFGYVKTKTPDETEKQLRKKLPREYWLVYNDRLVSLGQTICHPVSPKCTMCPLAQHCAKVGVSRFR